MALHGFVLRLESCGFMFIPLDCFGISPQNWAIKNTQNIFLVTLVMYHPLLKPINHGIFYGSINLDSHLLLPAVRWSGLIRIQHKFNSSTAWVVWCHLSIFLSPLCVCALKKTFPNHCPSLNLWHFPKTWWSTPTFRNIHFLVQDF